MLHVKEQKKDSKILLYERKYEGEGKYYQRGVCKDIKAGDEWADFMSPKTVLQVLSIDSVNDSKGQWNDPKDAEGSLFTGTFYDPNFVEHGANYQVLRQI